MERDEERIAAIMRRLLSRAKGEATRVGCPDEESLANYLSGLLSGAAKESLEAHLKQ